MPCGSLLTGETSAPPHASLGGKYANSKGGGNQICWGYEVCAGVLYTYDGKCDGTYIHTRDGARVPSGDVAIERPRILKHALQQHTVHERRRTGGVDVRAHALRLRTQKAEGIKYAGDTRCAPGYYIYDGKCDGTYCHRRDGARVPSGDVAIERGRTYQTCTAATHGA